MDFSKQISNYFLRDNKKRDTGLKLRARIAAAIILVVMLLLGISGNLMAYLGHLGVKDYYGEYYSEILNMAGVRDKQFAVEPAALLEEAFAFGGTEAEAEEKFGILARYCGKSTGGYELKFVTASEEKGCLWITYSNDTSKNVLVRLGIENGVVTDILEHP